MLRSIVVLLLLVVGHHTATAAPATSIGEVELSVFQSCRDPGWKQLTAYAGCDRSELVEVCDYVLGLTETAPDGCGIGALARWSACHSATMTSDEEQVCRSYLPTENKVLPDELKSVQVALDESVLRAEGFAPFGAAEPAVILGGAVQFFLGRAEAELLLFLRDRIADDVCTAEGRVLLAETCEYLRPAGEARPSDSLVALRDAFQNDLEALPVRIVATVREKVEDTCTTTPGHAACSVAWTVCLVETNRDVIPLLRKGQVRSAFERFADGSACTVGKPTWWDDFTNLMQGVVGFLAAAEEIYAERKALTPDDVDILLFAVEQLPDPVGGVADRLRKHRSVLIEMVVLLDRLRSPARYDADFIADFLDTSLRLAAAVAGETDNTGADADEFRDAIDSLRGLIEVANALSRRDYVQAVLRLLNNKALQAAISSSLPENARKTLAEFRRHQALIAAIASAEKPEDVQAALEAAASPVGSYREYRRRAWPGFLAGIIGIGGGIEALTGRADDGGYVSMFLPVGIETGIPIGKTSSFNIMLSLVDLGALTGIRPDGSSDDGADGDVKKTPENDFTTVFAPGLVFSLGLWDSPLTISFGGQYSPAGREYFACTSSACETTESSQAWRAFAFLGVDMPVYPLW